MPHELQFFEQLIIGIIREKEPIPERVTISALLTKEKERFLLGLHHRVCEAKSDEAVRIYIQEHQRIICHLSLMLDRLDQKEDHAATEWVEKTTETLKDIMFSLQLIYAPFFSKEGGITGTILKSVAKELEEQRVVIQEALKQADIDMAFVGCLMAPLNELLTIPDKQLTWHYYHYYKALFREISYLLDLSSTPSELQYVLWRCMVYFNFNAYGMFQYAKNQCKIRLAELESEEDQRQQLTVWIKKFSQCPVMPGCALRQNRASLAEQITNWLTVEKEFLIPVFKSEKRQDEVEMIKPAYKPRITLSVPRFAYLIKLLVQCSVFNTKHLSVVLKFFSTHFATQHSDVISLQSMRSHYYDPNRSTVYAIRDLLNLMLQQSKKDFP